MKRSLRIFTLTVDSQKGDASLPLSINEDCNFTDSVEERCAQRCEFGKEGEIKGSEISDFGILWISFTAEG